MNTKKINKVLLIEPPKTVAKELMKNARPTVQPPIGLTYIAALLEANKYNVKILDAIIEDPLCWKGTMLDENTLRFGLTNDQIRQVIFEYQPDVVGVSCVISIKYNDAKNICKIAKEVMPDCITIMGGAHPTFNIEAVLSDPNLDGVVMGEGDISCLEMIQYFEGKLGHDKLDGVAFKENKELVVIPKTRYIQDLDSLPFPARRLLPLSRYWEINLPHGEATRTPWTTIVTSRGCTASCIYCSAGLLWGKKYRARSAENVLKEIDFLVNNYGIKELLIEDDNFTLNKQRTIKILDGIIEKKWDISWTTPNGIAIFTLDTKMLEKIKKSGCSSITLAIESGSQRVLTDIMKKPLKISKVEEVVKEAKRIGLKTKAFFMLGIPGETKEEMNQTLDFARKVGVDWSGFNITVPLSGTELNDICIDNNYVNANINSSEIQFTSGRIHTSEFDEEFVNQKYAEANKINFLENPNLKEGGNVDRAIFDFKRVIRMVPEHELAHYALGMAYKKKNLTTEAIKMWQRVLEINPNNKLAKKNLRVCK